MADHSTLQLGQGFLASLLAPREANSVFRVAREAAPRHRFVVTDATLLAYQVLTTVTQRSFCTILLSVCIRRLSPKLIANFNFFFAATQKLLTSV